MMRAVQLVVALAVATDVAACLEVPMHAALDRSTKQQFRVANHPALWQSHGSGTPRWMLVQTWSQVVTTRFAFITFNLVFINSCFTSEKMAQR